MRYYNLMGRCCKCSFLVPLAYNDGRPVEAEFWIEMKTVLDRRFGGYRIPNEGPGSWHGQVEQTKEVVVYVVPERVHELREVVIAIGKRLEQKQMAFDVSPPTVELIDIDPGGGDEAKRGTLWQQ